MLVFCLKFRLAPVCEYLNYYYGISNYYWAIPEKIRAGGFEGIIFLEKKSWNFYFYHFTLRNSWQNKALTLQIPWNCVTPLGNSKAKNEDLRRFNIFPWSILEIPPLFQLNPGISTWYFLIFMKIPFPINKYIYICL